MNRLGPAQSRALGTWLIVAFVVALATCAARYAVDMVLSLGAAARTGDTASGKAPVAEQPENGTTPEA